METLNSIDTIPEEKINLEDAFSQLVGGNDSSLDTNQQLLEIASKHTLQLTAQQKKRLIYLKREDTLLEYGGYQIYAESLRNFVDEFLKYTSYQNSQRFMIEALRQISYNNLLNANTLKVNVDKNT